MSTVSICRAKHDGETDVCYCRGENEWHNLVFDLCLEKESKYKDLNKR